MSDESQLSESPAPRSRMTRRLVILAGAVLLLVIGSVVALKLVFTPEKLRALVVPRLEAALGREVQLSAVRLRLFPRIAVRLDEVAVASPAGFSSDPMLQIDALDLQVKLRPLLRREIVLGQVRLLNPLIRYEVLSDGTNNFSGLGGGRDTEEDVAGDAAAAAAAGLLVTDLAIRGGRMVYADARSGRRAEFGIDARVSVERGEENTAILESSGRVELTDIRARLSGEPNDTIAWPEARIEYALALDMAGDSISLREARLELGELSLSSSGVMRGLRRERMLDLNVESDEIDIARLLASLPGDHYPGLRARGRLMFSLKASGSLVTDPGPTVSGTAELRELDVDYVGYEGLIANGDGTLVLSMEALTVRDFTARLLGQPMEARFTISNFKDPIIDGRLSGDLDLARLAALQDDPLPVTGGASFQLEIAGPLKRRERLRLTGPVQLTDVNYQNESLAVPARIASGSVHLTGAGIILEELPIEIGTSEFRLSLTGDDVIPMALAREKANTVPTLEFTLTSDRFNLHELTGGDPSADDGAGLGYPNLVTARLAGRDVDGRDPGEIAAEHYSLPAMPPLEVVGRVMIAELINPPTDGRDIAFDLVLRNGVLEVKNLEGELYGGAVAGALEVDFSSASAPFPLHYEISLQGANAGAFVSRWTRLGEALTGAVDFTVGGSALLDESLLPAPEAVNAEGRTTFSDGRFLDFGPANSLLDRFGLDDAASSAFQRLGGPFKIEGGALLLEGWRLIAGDLKANIDGSAGLGGTLDLSLGIEVPQSTLEKAGLLRGSGALSGLLGQLTGSNESIELSLRIGGTVSQPIIQLDTDALQSALEARLQEEGRNLLDRLLRRPPPPPPPLPPLPSLP